MPCPLSDEEFEGAIEAALDSIPDELISSFENVVVLVEDEPLDWQPADAQDPALCAGAVVDSGSGDLLGLYDGVNLLQRGNGYGAVDDWPDTITIFKGPHERLSDDRAVVLEEVRKTVIHEVGHYFGMTEEQVEEMGYA